jgi:hypothetical protein
VGTAVQTTVTKSEVACTDVPLDAAMTALYETDAGVALVTVHDHVVP